MSLLLALLLSFGSQAGATPPPPPEYFTSPFEADEIRDKQAVLETSLGTIVLDLLSDAAPNHVGHFIVRAREGAYDGTVFHRVIPMGIIQGGDPLSSDSTQTDLYGTGGLNELRFEGSPEKHTRGAVSAVLVPGKPDSAGAQFFICITDQPALDGQYTVFARVAEGINVAQQISQGPADATGVPAHRMEILSVTIRDTPLPEPEPFSLETVEELSFYRAVVETSMGDITLEFFPDRAAHHVRNFLRLASSGVYDGTAFHRVAKGFVIQGGHLPTRREPLDERQQGFVRPLQPEFNPTSHDRGILSMARLADPGSATSSFFIVTAPSPGIDGQYTVFGRVVEGLEVVAQIEAVPVDGETPVTRVDVPRVTVTRVP